MDMAIKHDLVNSVATLRTVTGSYLVRAKLSKVERAFIAADLYSGAIQLVYPTVVQSAWLAQVSDTYAHHALRKSERDRALVESGVLPLWPSAVRALPPPSPVSPEQKLSDVVAEIGINNTLVMLAAFERTAAAV